MDLVHGQTLEEWLKQYKSLECRWELARRLVDDVCGMAHSGLFHGDLHARNIMITTRRDRRLDSGEFIFRLIDFGTSRFTSRGASRARHWRVFTETVDRIVSPFSLHSMKRGKLPVDDTAAVIRDWYRARLEYIRRSLIWHSASWLVEGDELHEFYRSEFYKSEWIDGGWEDFLASFLPVPPEGLSLTSNLINRGVLKITEEELGPGRLWSPLESTSHSATWEERGPPWTTSMTDRAWLQESVKGQTR